GKVPVAVIRRMVGRGIVIEELNQLVGEKIEAYIQEEGLEILGQPLPLNEMQEEDFDPKAEKEMTFKFEVGIAPKIDLDLMLDEKPVLYQISIDDETLEEEIKALRDRFGIQEQVEEVQAGDVVFGKIRETGEDGEPLEDGLSAMIPLNPQRVDKPEVFAALEGKKLEERLPFDLFSLADDEKALADLTFLEAEQIEAFKGKSTVLEITRINRFTLAELDETFFGKVAEANGWDTDEAIGSEDAFRDRLREHLETQNQDAPKRYFRRKVQEQLIKQHPLTFPEAFLKKWLGERNKDKTPEAIEAEMPQYLESLTWSMIVGQLIKENPDLEVSADDLKEGIMDSIRETMPDMDEQRAQEIFSYFAQNQELLNMHYNRMTDDRIFGFLEEKIEPETQLISQSDFEAMKKAEEAAKAEAQGDDVVVEELDTEPNTEA
ncbi:MAG: hypothetical protein D6722_19410, partial [Bacteroidetes bacterium]